MKKRLVSLLLCLVMAVSVLLTGCGDKTGEEILNSIDEKAYADNITLSMWVVSEKPVSKETADLVTAALNAITEDGLKTRLAVTYYTMDQYEAKLSAAINAFDRATAPAVPEDPNKQTTLFDPKYPALLENQVDIIYLEGKEMYTSYLANGWLAALDSEFTSSVNKPLQEYVSDELRNAAKLDGMATYAIPNNNLIGEYTYMLLNRDLVDTYYGGFKGADKVAGLYDNYIYDFLETVFDRDNDDYNVLDASYEECLALLAHYWSFDTESYDLLKDFSVFGHAYASGDVVDLGQIELKYENLFANEGFKNAFLRLNGFEADGYFENEAEKPAAVKIEKGDILSLAPYEEDYYTVILQYPTVDEEDVFDNGMYAVCSKTVSIPRSMEVITYINTNADFRNTLLYGVQGTHYDTEPSDMSEDSYTLAFKINDDYCMSMAKTGNIILAYPTDTAALSAYNWEMLKRQNLIAMTSPTLGYDFAVESYLNKDLTKYLEALNADLSALIDAVKSTPDWYADLAVLVEELGELLDPNSTKTVEEFVVLKDYLESDDFKNLIVEEQDGAQVGVNDLAALRKNLQKAMSKDAQNDLYSPYGAYRKWIEGAKFTISTKK